MGKTIKLTEEQIMRFFGPGFGKVILGEGTKGKAKQNAAGHSEDVLDTNGAKDLASKKYGGVMGHNNGGEEGALYHRGFHYTPREGNDLPGYGGSVVKMADFGSANLTDENAVDNNALLREIIKIRNAGNKAGEANKPLNLIDVLDILHQLNGKKIEAGERGKEAFDFLNSINVDYILSNFVTVNAPDYVFWRLKNLTPEELQNIKTVYKRDFSGFGQRCDGCGITEWKTTITPFEHDDSHINLEYMGSQAASAPVQITESGGPRAFHKFPVPFQIHHMNENAGDNSPLNLSCLCPNCHALTGSYGRPKNDIDEKAMGALSQLEDMLGGESGATGSLAETLMSPGEKKKIVNALKNGEFERRDVVNSQMGVGMGGNLELDSSDPSLLSRVKQFGVENPESFIKQFNSFFNSIWDEGLKEYTKHHNLNEGIYLMEDEEEPEDDSNDPADTSSVTDGILDGVKYTYEVRCSKRGNVTLFLYAGEPPFIFNAFKNHYISLTPMYYENGEYRNKAKIEIRNRIFGAVLNSMIQAKKGKISNWDAPSWAKEDVKDDAGNVTGRRIVMNKIKGMRASGEPTIKNNNGEYDIFKQSGYLDVQSMFPSQESDNYSIGKEQSLAAKKQAKQKLVPSLTDLKTLYVNIGNEKLKNQLNKDGKPKYQPELIEYVKYNAERGMTFEEFVDTLLEMGLARYK